jgi:hypothetical protein
MEEEEPLGRYLEGGALALETGARKRESFTTGPELDRSDLGGGPAHAPLVMGMLDLEETEEMECVCEMAEEGVPLEELMCECCVVMGGAFEAIGGGQAHCDDMVPVARGTWTRGCDAEVTEEGPAEAVKPCVADCGCVVWNTGAFRCAIDDPCDWEYGMAEISDEVRSDGPEDDDKCP